MPGVGISKGGMADDDGDPRARPERAAGGDLEQQLRRELRRIGVFELGEETVTVAAEKDVWGDVSFNNWLGDHWRGPAADAIDRLSLLPADAGADAFWRAFPDFPGSARRQPHAPVPLVKAIAVLTTVWLVGTVIYFVSAAGGLSLGGNCGPPAFLGREGSLHGGGYASGLTGVALGAVLFVAAVIAAIRAPGWRGQLLLAFLLLLPAALLALWFGIAPDVWGPEHCVIAQ